jgi:tellurite resistance protein
MYEDVARMDRETRRLLVQLACFGAWSDLEVHPREREVVLQIAMNLALEDDLEEVKGWLQHAPPEVDPNKIPVDQRQAFMDALVAVVLADGRVTPEESITVRLIREMLFQ